MKYVFGLLLALAIFLRMYGLQQFPPSIYWEEAALGYDAYSILLTGKDHHGNSIPVVAFESFGDWKPSGYYYLLVPFIAVFGLDDWVVRLPTVLAGLALILGTARIARKMGCNEAVALGVGAVSPWAIQFSRAGWEVMSASAFLVWGNYWLLTALEAKTINFKKALAGIFVFAAAMYTYHATRLIIPLLLVGLASYYFAVHAQSKQFFAAALQLISLNKFKIITLIVLFVGVVSPLLLALGNPVISQRFNETSIFSDISVIEKSNEYKAAAGNTVWARIFYHRYLLFAQIIAQNFFSHFTLDFLILTGDENLRHSINFMGQLYHIELVFLLVGAYIWFKKISALKVYLLFWLVVAVLPASVTTGTPHALRILPALPIFIMVITSGIQQVYSYIVAVLTQQKVFKKHSTYFPASIVAIILISGAYAVELTAFWRYYSKVYPVVASQEWQYGYKQMVSAVAQYKAAHPDTPIYITREQGRPAMYYWFYTKTDPKTVQSENAAAEKDQGEFLTFQNILFIDRVDQVKAGGLVVSSAEFMDTLKPQYTTTTVDSVDDLLQNNVWKLYTIE